MKKIKVSTEHIVWDDFHIVKLVHLARKCKCSIDINADKKYINMKSVMDMMEFLDQMMLHRDLEICLDGNDESQAAIQIENYFTK